MKNIIGGRSHSKRSSSPRDLDPEKTVLINTVRTDTLIESADGIIYRARPENCKRLIPALDKCCLRSTSAAVYNVPETTIKVTAS